MTSRVILPKLKRIIGRIEKVKIARGILFLMFVLLFMPVTQALSEIATISNWSDAKNMFATNPIFWLIIVIPIIVLILILLLIHKIDKWEDKKAEKRHDELLKAIKDNRPIIFNRSVIYGKRKSRNL